MLPRAGTAPKSNRGAKWRSHGDQHQTSREQRESGYRGSELSSCGDPSPTATRNCRGTGRWCCIFDVRRASRKFASAQSHLPPSSIWTMRRRDKDGSRRSRAVQRIPCRRRRPRNRQSRTLGDGSASRLSAQEFRALGPTTRRVRRQILEGTYGEPIAPGKSETFGDCPLTHFRAKAIKVLRDQKNRAGAADCSPREWRRRAEGGLAEPRSREFARAGHPCRPEFREGGIHHLVERNWARDVSLLRVRRRGTPHLVH